MQLIEDARQSLMDGSVDYIAFIMQASSLKGRFTDAISALGDDQREALEEVFEGVYDNVRGAGGKEFTFEDKRRFSFGTDGTGFEFRRFGSPFSGKESLIPSREGLLPPNSGERFQPNGGLGVSKA